MTSNTRAKSTSPDHDDILVKLDPKTGKTLWSIKPAALFPTCPASSFYTIQSLRPNPMDGEQMSDMTLQKPALPAHRRGSTRPMAALMWKLPGPLPDQCPVQRKLH